MSSTPGRGSAEAPGRGAHIILVGLPGAGKTTVGREAARAAGRPFLDFDEEIERREGRPVAAIFADRGETHFRALERALTGELRGSPAMVLAPGGGWVTSPDVVALLRPPGRIIYLKVTPREALARLGVERSMRPLLRVADPSAELERLFERRRAMYETADVVLDTEVLTRQELVARVARLATEAALPGGGSRVR